MGTTFRNAMLETKEFGFENATKKAQELGEGVRKIFADNGFKSVASKESEAPTVVVVYAETADMVAKFKQAGLQIAGGVPFKVDEPAGLLTFRIGLFGLDKLKDVKAAIDTFEKALKMASA